ncbi:hypothetical protein GGS23DRAFT_567692, partial [Durotheca rogersii]|uniref:uncharacterized protein n=1 Tax=Durotheca rogersii TaxID=419775 RepID=UPI00221EFE6D
MPYPARRPWRKRPAAAFCGRGGLRFSLLLSLSLSLWLPGIRTARSKLKLAVPGWDMCVSVSCAPRLDAAIFRCVHITGMGVLGASGRPLQITCRTQPGHGPFSAGPRYPR